VTATIGTAIKFKTIKQVIMNAKQQMMVLLRDYLASFTMLPEEFLCDFDEKVELNEFEKGHYLLKQGSVCEHMHYIITGCVQCYIGTKDKKETLWFMMEGELAIFKLRDAARCS